MYKSLYRKMRMALDKVMLVFDHMQESVMDWRSYAAF